MRKKLFFVLVFPCVMLFFACGDQNYFGGIADKNSEEAKLETARMKIDKGDYQGAIGMLEAQCASPEAKNAGSKECTTLATAYMGEAGLNVVEMMKNIDAVVNEGASVDFNFSTVSKLFPEVTTENITNMTKAVDILSQKENRTTDEELQLGMAAATNLVLTVGQLTNGFDDNGIPNTIPSLEDLTQSVSNINGMESGETFAAGEFELKDDDSVALAIAKTAVAATSSAAKTGQDMGLVDDNLQQIEAVQEDIANSDPESEDTESPGKISNEDVQRYISNLTIPGI